MIKKHLGLILVLQSSLALAQQSTYLAKYYDCASSNNFISDSISVFTKVNGKKIQTPYKAKDYTRGISISVNTGLDGLIETFSLGDGLKLESKEFESGIEFGIVSMTAHTIQLISFNPATGGVIEFGFLKNIVARKRKSIVNKDKNLNDYYKSVYENDWGTFQVYLEKNQATNSWKIKDENSNDVNAIFGIMKMKGKAFVVGISDMLVITNANLESMIQTDHSIKIKYNDRLFECSI